MQKQDGVEIVYATVLQWPFDNKVILGAAKATSKTKVTMLGYGPLSWMATKSNLMVYMPSVPFTKLPSIWAWTLKLEYLSN